MGGTTYYAGLDLGQSQDPTALAVIERTERGGAARYAARWLQRWPLRTPYPQIVAEVRARFRRPPLGGGVLCVDATGVGRPVVDLFREAGIDAQLVPITITGGSYKPTRVSGFWSVPKKDLVGCLQVVLSSRRFQVAPALPEAETLLRELETFRVKLTAAGNETFESWRERDHDDLVLAAALPLWYAEKAPRLGRPHFLSWKREPARQVPRVVVCPSDRLAKVEVEPDEVCLLVSVTDPGSATAVPGALPFECPPGDRLALGFADLAPADFGGDYSSPVAPWGLPAEKLVMHRQDHGKQLWRFLLKKRETAPNVYVFTDSGGGDRRALSLAYAVADVLRLPRQQQVFCPADPEARHDGAPAPNPHVYETARQGRVMVIM